MRTLLWTCQAGRPNWHRPRRRRYPEKPVPMSPIWVAPRRASINAVQSYVGVGMTDRRKRRVYVDPADPQRTAGGQAMYVVSLSDTFLGHGSVPLARAFGGLVVEVNRPGQGKIALAGDFQISLCAFVYRNRVAAMTQQRGLVGEAVKFAPADGDSTVSTVGVWRSAAFAPGRCAPDPVIGLSGRRHLRSGPCRWPGARRLRLHAGDAAARPSWISRGVRNGRAASWTSTHSQSPTAASRPDNVEIDRRPRPCREAAACRCPTDQRFGPARQDCPASRLSGSR